MLFDYATVFSLPIKQDYNTESQQKLHSLIKRREQLILIKNQEIARLDKAANDTFIKKSLEEVLSCLEKQLTAIENVIKDKYKSNDDLVVIDIDQALLEKMTTLKQQPKGFPTILYITDEGETLEEYNEEDEKIFRKIESFEKWIDSKMKNKKGGKRKTRRTRKTRKIRKTRKTRVSGKSCRSI